MNGLRQAATPASRHRVTLIAALLCSLALIGLGAPGSIAAARPAARPPVVLLVVDEFPTVALMNRAGGISASRFPNFHRLSREGIWYRNHTTVASLTRHSVPGILSGRYVKSGDPFATTANYPVNIFTQLRAVGYRVEALESATRICPVAICSRPAGISPNPAKFASSADFQNANVRQVWGPTRDDLVAWARQQKFEPRKFIFRHLLVPHHPYDHVPSGQKYDSGPIPEPFSVDAPTINAPIGNLRLSFQRLMLQVGYVDRVIGELRKAAKRQGKWKSTMLVVVGDHGLSHEPGRPFRTFQADTAGSVAFTPLFIKYPGRTKGEVSSLPTRGVDVFPTIARVLGATAPGADGEPISRLAPELRDVIVDGQSLPFGVAAKNRREAVRFRDRLLGYGGLFRLGRATHLIGHKAGGTPSDEARLDNPGRFRRLDPKAGSVPALVSGRAPSLRPGAIVAVSVNGVIRATAEVFADARRRRFGTMVNPRFFRQKNEIGVYLVKDGHLHRRLK